MPPAPPEEEAGGGEGDQQITVTEQASTSVIVITEVDGTNTAKFFTNTESDAAASGQFGNSYVTYSGYIYPGGVYYFEPNLMFAEGSENMQYLYTDSYTESGYITLNDLDITEAALAHIGDHLQSPIDKIYLITGSLETNADVDTFDDAPSWTLAINGNVDAVISFADGLTKGYYILEPNNDEIA